MENKKLLQYFKDQVLSDLGGIDFKDTEHEDYEKAQETLSQVLSKYKLKFNSKGIVNESI